MKQITRYPGSKWSISEWIIDHFPANYEKMVYLEPFFGSGAVFFRKAPSAVETINGLDSDVVNLFAVIRDRPEQLARALELTPYSREEYNRAFDPGGDPVEQARRFVIRTAQAIGAKMSGKCGWRNHKQIRVGGSAYLWHGIPDAVMDAASRLRGSATNAVQIEHTDALHLIERHNDPGVLMYLDPPYLHGTRKGGRLYRHEMDDAGHRKLLELLQTSRASIVLSGYESDLYDRALVGWHKYVICARTTSAEMTQEVIWCNYEAPEQQICIAEQEDEP